MQLCYVDESGTAQKLVNTDPEQQPVIVIAGVSLPEGDLTAITHDWINLKTKFYPSIAKRGHGWLDAILADVKGTKVRSRFRSRATHRQKRQAVALVDATLALLEHHHAKILGRIWIKPLDFEHNGMSLYATSLQFICAAFDSGLPSNERGMVVVDSQTYRHNHQLAHSIFTQRFGMQPKHCGLVDMPVFGHSDNHAGLQIADLLCSAVLAPIACAVYAGAYAGWNQHCDSAYIDIREQFGQRLEALTFTCPNQRTGKPCSSIVVRDPVGRRGTRLMWHP
ncbi:MAG: DUF3800 domain-containing protein [Solirubrobacteraceae bacterium]